MVSSFSISFCFRLFLGLLFFLKFFFFFLFFLGGGGRVWSFCFFNIKCMEFSAVLFPVLVFILFPLFFISLVLFCLLGVFFSFCNFLVFLLLFVFSLLGFYFFFILLFFRFSF